ncbi:MAG: TatD family hydrolase, partial [Bacteroidales bacterium]|nr:TatD family hydrolase [Bacteroidales bacterium]
KSLIRDVVKLIPLEYLLLETDAPYLTPTGFGKKRNEPSSIPLIAKTIAEIKAVTIDEVAEFTTINAFSLFNFNSVNKQHIKH